MSRWRLIEDEAAEGPWNMGIDEALVHSASRSGQGILRLYQWRGPWLSLGYAQRRLPEAMLEACRQAGVGIVRRTTGGRAVLHGADLTYAVIAPESLLQPGLRGAYDQIANALLTAVQSLGLPGAERAAGPPGTGASTSFDCFAQPAGDEICVGGRKLIGSAQRRSRGMVLQHGSIRVSPDPEAAVAAAGLAGSPATSLRELGWLHDERALRDRLLEAFSAVFDAAFAIEAPSEVERASARQRVLLHRADPLSAPSPKGPPPATA